MGRFIKKCLPPSSPYIEYVEPLELTTTQSPEDSFEYFSIPNSGSLCPAAYFKNNICFCGSISISDNPYLNIINDDDSTQYFFSYNQKVLIDKGNLFISTVSSKVSVNNINKFEIYLGQQVTLNNRVQVLIKNKTSSEIIAHSVIGNDGESYVINFIELCVDSQINLNNDIIQVEFYSLCYDNSNDCCDKLPSAVSLSEKVLSLPCSTTTTTTTTTQTPFCDRFNLPNLFYVTVIGYGVLDGQEQVVLVTKNNNVYSTSGTFPCGANFYLQMVCDSITEKFYYDGSIDCCNPSSKIIIDETSRPIIVPGAKLPPIVFYLNCDNCTDCTTTTTSTTTTSPPLPCNDEYFGPLTINGYAFYKDKRSTEDIPGIGTLTSPCFGGHICDRTDFIPQLILSDQTIISGNPISLNNSPGGGDRSATFTFNISDVTLLKSGASVRLQCASDFCHNGITWVVLTSTINEKTIKLFDNCVLPNSIDDLIFGCEDCCNWDGGNFIEFVCNEESIRYNLRFYKINTGLFEANTAIECGDSVRALLKCDPTVDIGENPSTQDCLQKWQMLAFQVPCAQNARLTGNLLELCECDKPPIFEWAADNLNDCGCCGPPFNIDWDLTWGDTLNGNPWSITNNNTSIRFSVDDSANCGGLNANTQFGEATATITVGDSDVIFDILFDGIAELQDFGFEIIAFYLNGNLIGSATSAGGGLGCAMGPIAVGQQPETQILLAGQTYTFLINFTTADPLYHVGSYYQINLIFNNILPPTTTPAPTTTTTTSTTTTTTTPEPTTTTTTIAPHLRVTDISQDVLSFEKLKQSIISVLNNDILTLEQKKYIISTIIQTDVIASQKSYNVINSVSNIDILCYEKENE